MSRLIIASAFVLMASSLPNKASLAHRLKDGCVVSFEVEHRPGKSSRSEIRITNNAGTVRIDKEQCGEIFRLLRPNAFNPSSYGPSAWFTSKALFMSPLGSFSIGTMRFDRAR